MVGKKKQREVNREPGTANNRREQDTARILEKEKWNQMHKLKLPEVLDNISLQLTEAVYIEPGQEHCTMGQIRLMKWIDENKNAPAALTNTYMEFTHEN